MGAVGGCVLGHPPSVTTLNHLVNKRLVIKSGDRLNVYWDIFRDYILTGHVPIIPFNYIPTTDISSMIKVSKALNKNDYLQAKDIANKNKLNEKTIWNIGADLVMFGLAERNGVRFKLHKDIDEKDVESETLMKLRERMSKHALNVALFKNRAGQSVSQDYIKEILKSCLPNATYSNKTWLAYSNRLIRILLATGYLVNAGKQFTIQNTGTILAEKSRIGSLGNKKSLVFPATASPASVCDALTMITDGKEYGYLILNGYRNSLSILKRLKVLSVKDKEFYLNKSAIEKLGGINESIWTLAKNEPVISVCIDYMQNNSSVSAVDLGTYISNKYEMKWTDGSIKRNGNGLRQWSLWVSSGIMTASIPTPPGRKK